MTKKAKISFLILVWSIVAIQIYVNYQEKMKHSTQLVTAFSVEEDLTEKSVAGEVVSGYGYFGAMDLSDEMKKKMLVNLAQKLGITDGYHFMNGSGTNYEKMMLVKEGRFADTTLQIISMGSGKEQYIVMKIEAKEQIDKALSLYQKVKRIYEEIGIDGQVRLEIALDKDGDIRENAELTERILDMTEAKKVGAITENEIYTIYGFTKYDASYLKLSGEKVNIQVVMSYDEEKDQTNVKIGIPIVNTSY